MDKTTFNEVISNLPVNGFEAQYHYWCGVRQNMLKTIPVDSPNIDYHLVQAVAHVLSIQGLSAVMQIETMFPGFCDRIKQYRALQTQIMLELQQLHKESAKQAALFREYQI